MLRLPRDRRPFVGMLVVLVLLAQPSVWAGALPQETSQAPDVKTQHPASGKHTVEQIQEILKRAREGVVRVQNEVRDYECVVYKLERVDGKLEPGQYMLAKIRHEQKQGDKITVPFSVYLKFLKPARYAGREVIYVRGKNDDLLTARRGGRSSNPDMTLELEPNSATAMSGNRYPITEIGVVNMVRRLIEVMEKEVDPDSCEIKVFAKAKMNDRDCTRYELGQTKRLPGVKFMKATVFVDNEFRIPILYAAYDWPAKEGGEPVLIEQYAYMKVKLNVGLTDKDFDRDNPEYKFSEVKPLPADASP